MRKILSLILGLLWALPAFADLDPCRNLFDKDSLYNINLPLSRNGFFPSGNGNPSSLPHAYTYFLKTKPNTTYTISMATPGDRLNIYGIKTIVNPLDYSIESPLNFDYSLGSAPDDRNSNAPVSFTTYDNTKMVAIYYSLYKEPTDLQIEEGDTATAYVPYCEKIKIATTKYNETKFSPLNTALANAISVVDTVVSNTITQAGRIATLQAQKQTRPNDIADDSEKCPAGKKCLLVEDASGTPHWYEIVERYSRLPDGYTELEYIQTDGNSWINTGYIPNGKPTIKTKLYASALVSQLWGCRWTPAPTYDTLGAIVGSGGNLTIYYGLYGNEEFTVFSGYRTGVVHTFELGESSIIYDGLTTNISRENISSTYSFVVGGFNNNGEINQTGISRIYSMEVKESGNMMLNLIPAKNASGVVGMYDKVNDVFYENQGTGEFIAGDPVSE